MTTLTLTSPKREAGRRLRHESAVFPAVAKPPPLLLFSDDEPFWQKLRRAASEAGRELVRKRANADAAETLRLLKPAVVLLDLDGPAQTAWNAADSLLQDPGSPPLLLLTARTRHVDFKTAIQAGSLVDKSECPAKLLEMAGLTLESPDAAQRERNASQKVVIRWLKPCNWSAEVIQLQRFWGINE